MGAMDLKKWRALRQVRLGAQSGAGVLALAGVLIFANLLGQRFVARLDWTEGRRYSLSAASKKLVRGLPDPLLLRAYVSGGLPQPHAGNAQYLHDLLGEYRAVARGKVTVETTDPDASADAGSDARKAGVVPVRFTQVTSDRFQVREGFLGLVIFYQDKQETIPFVKDPGELEYEITSRLKKMSRQGKKTLAFVIGHGETAPEDLRRGAGERLYDAFHVRALTLDGSAKQESPPDVLIVANPGQPFKEAEVAALDALVSSGVPTALFVSPKTVAMDSFGVYPRSSGLEKFLAHYGARVEDGIVLDAQCQQVTMQSRQNGFTVANIIHYPAFILSRPEPHPAAQSLSALMFPFAGAVVPTGAGTFTPLARSSARSWMPPDLMSLDPYRLPPPQPADAEGPFTLLALVEGSTAAFHDPSRAVKYRLVVSGAGSFTDGQLPLPAENIDFLVQMAEWLAEGDSFTPIPSHGDGFRPLRPLPAPVRGFFKFMGYFFLPGVSAFLGVLLWRRRSARRPAVQKEWEAASRA